MPITYFANMKNVLLVVMILLSSFQEIIAISAESKDCDTVEIKKHLKVADQNIDNFVIAKQTIDQAINEAYESECVKWISKAIFNKGSVYYRFNEYDSAILFFQKSRSLYSSINDFKGVLRSIAYLSYIYYEKYDYFEAIEYGKQGLYLADSIGDIGFMADFYLNIGSSYDEMGELEEAFRNYLLAEKIYLQDIDSSGLISCYINMGIIYSQNDNFIESIEYFEKAKKIGELVGDTISVSVCYNNIGDVYIKQQKYHKALDYFFKSLDVDRNNGDRRGEAICLNNIGDVYRKIGDTVVAMSYYQKCHEIASVIVFPITGIVEENISSIYLNKGDNYQALKYAKLSLEHAKQMSDIKQEISSYYLLNKIYKAIGDFEKAYYHLEKYRHIDDSINTVSQSRFINGLTAKYNVEKQKTKISELQKESRDSHSRTLVLLFIIVSIIILILIMFVVNQTIRRSRKIARHSKLYYEKLLEGSDDFIFVSDETGHTKYISPSYERKIGRVINSRIGGDTFEFIHPDDVDFVRKGFAELIQGKKIMTADFRMQLANEEYITIHAVGQNFLNDGLINGILINFWDITQMVNNEKAIRENELRFRQIFNAFPDIYFQSTLDGEITEISPSVKKLTGYDRKELLTGSENLGLIIKDDWDIILSNIEKEIEVHDVDIKMVTKNNVTIDCSLSAEVIISGSYNQVFIKGVIRDISSRIKNQKEVNESQKQLKEANEAKEKLFSIIAHDLIGPIGTNKSIIDLIVTQMDSLTYEEVVSLIASLKPSIDATFALIENLLSWARIQQDRLVPNIEKLSLVSLVSLVISVVAGQAKKKLVNLVFEYKQDMVLLADRNQLDIAIRNLVSNAIKFSPANSSVVITLEKGPNSIELRISDSGIGMKQSDIDNLINQNSAIDVRRGTDNEKGTGFGLLIVNEFVKSNKGILKAITNPGEGTTFILSFPINLISS